MYDLVRCRLRIKGKKTHYAKPPLRTRPDLINLNDTSCHPKYQNCISEALIDLPDSQSITDRWDSIKSIINTSALNSLGKQRRKQPDWFLHSAQALLPAITAKRTTRLAFLNNSNPSTKAAYLSAKAEVQRCTRLALCHYWSELSERITRCLDTGNIHGMYSGIIEALGPSPKNTAPLRALDGTLLTEVQAQLDRWV